MSPSPRRAVAPVRPRLPAPPEPDRPARAPARRRADPTAQVVAPVMGTTVSIDVRDPGVGPEVLNAAVAVLREQEARFSPFLGDSEVRRLERGELSIEAAHPDVREVLDTCA